MTKHGQLIALEGGGSPSMHQISRRMVRSLARKSNSTESGGCGLSRWDASGIFYDILQGDRDLPGASPRTLLLLYATDLAFRLRWDIRPALEQGMIVVAAPYIESAIAFGRAAGLPKVWLKELFRFAPNPDACYRVAEDRIPWNKRGKPVDSFLEFCFRHLRKSSASWEIEDIRKSFLAQLRDLEKRGRCELVSRKLRAG